MITHKTASGRSKVLSNIRSTRVSRKLKLATVQSKITDSILRVSKIILQMKSKTIVNDREVSLR